MSASDTPRAELRSLALQQANVVSREQARALGVSDRVVARLVRQQHWRRVTPGIYLTADVEPTFLARAWAGVLIGGDSSRLGRLAAARLQGLADVDPRVVTVWVEHGRAVSERPGFEFLRERPDVRGRTTRGDPPRTNVEDTVLDLCSTAQPEDVVGWLTLAVERRRTTGRRLLRALAGRRRHPHRQLIEGLLADVEVGVRSPLEMTYLRDVERAHGLSALVTRQLPSLLHKAVRDVCYTDFGVVVELDGRLGHDELGRFRDMNRDNLANLDGLLTLRYGAADLHGRPCAVAAQVARALHRRGWTGLATRCPRCLRVPDQDWV
ncbi:MAG: type IV toxin-antitoxin system AbiEi family antitoxin domain-containing protein [Janthinobacterium lividum]